MPSPTGRTLTRETAQRNAWIEVDLDAIDHNVATLRAALGSSVELIAVVKANAYGHGVEGLAPVLERAGVDRFAVVWTAEAVALRSLGVTLPILALGHSFPMDAVALVFNDITQVVHSIELGEALSRAAVAQGKAARVHIKIDTGLHRFGLALEDAVTLAEQLRALPSLEVEGLTTHMANADEADDSFGERQDGLFAEAAHRLPWIPYRHTANSATALRRPAFRYDGVRIGLALHGVLPPNTPVPLGGLRPTLSLKARIARVSDIPAGDGVSYGLAWRARQAARVALIPVGYADGWRRSLGNKGSVLVRGQRCPIVGRVAMDQFLIDVTNSGDVAEGEDAVLLGSQGDGAITVEEIAALEDTITWEVLAGLQARLPRIYHRRGVVERAVG